MEFIYKLPNLEAMGIRGFNSQWLDIEKKQMLLLDKVKLFEALWVVNNC